MNQNLRKLGAGDWYWINKAVIKQYAGTLGFSEIAVYNFLASMVDDAQQCFPSQKYIAEHLHCSRATVNRAIKKLEKHYLIFIQRGKNNRCVYSLLEVECNRNEIELSHERNSDVKKEDTNNTKEQELENNTVVRVQKKLPSYFSATTREELLAQDIADILQDHENARSYLSFVHKYPESFLRNILSEVKRTPERKIRKSRKALFMYLVNYYAHKNT